MLLKIKQTNILSAALIMMAAVFISRLLGLLRDWLLAYFFTPTQLGIYFAAFRLPDMVFSIIVMGALTTAFIPVITGYLVKGEKETAFKVASSIINLSLLVFLVLATIIFIFASPLSSLIAPGFSQAELTKVAYLTRVMLFAQLFFVVSNFLTGILQAEKQFILPALAPVAYNFGIIIGIFVLAPFFGLYGPAIGVLIGAFLHFIIQLPLVKEQGFHYKSEIDFKSPGVKKIGRLMLPRTIGLITSQINFTIDNILASLIAPSAITILNFAQHLQQLPIGLFGVTIAQAALPSLSEERTKNNLENFKTTLLSSVRQILFLTMPATVVLIVLRIPLVRLIFGAVKFDWQATVFTSLTLACFSIGVVFQSLTHLFARAYYSLFDSQTPLLVVMISAVVNIGFSIILIYSWKLPVWGLAISSSLADMISAGLLFLLLKKKLVNFGIKGLIKPLLKILFASSVMGLVIYFNMKLMDFFVLDTTRTINLIFLTMTSLIIGFLIFIILSWKIQIEEFFIFGRLFKKAGRILLFLRQPPVEVTSPSETTI